MPEVRVLITAGPTREYLDDARFLSNASSGRMGAALAGECVSRGLRTTVVAGPLSVGLPDGLERVDVISAQDMYVAVDRRFPDVDILLMCAAVADFRPASRRSGKIKKSEAALELALAPTTDILLEMGRKRRAEQVLVGFALESHRVREYAERKLRSKNLDLVVANSTRAIGADRTSATIIDAGGRETVIADSPKEDIARVVVDLAVAAGLRNRGLMP